MEESLELTGREREAIDIERKSLELEEQEYERQKLTYQILTTENKMEAKGKDIQVIETKLAHLGERRDTDASKRQNIQISKVKRSISELDEELRHLKVELKMRKRTCHCGCSDQAGREQFQHQGTL